jgi:hypothetical protein
VTTAPDLDLLRQLRPWLDRATGMIDRRIADARVHAAAGNLPAAERRLGELTESLTRHLGDARSHFYRSAFVAHRRNGLDPAIHDTAMAPTPEGEAASRSAEVLGRNYVHDVLDLVSDAQAGLQSATLAGGREYLDGWAREHRDRIESRARSELSNSQIAIFEAVRQILVKPEFR